MTASPLGPRTALLLIGDARIAGSPSPLLHDAVFGPGTYGLLADDDATRAFDAAERVCRGVNVTAPHKVAAAQRYAAVLDDHARRTGAANTVVYDDDGRALLASNTDVAGLLAAWRRASFVVEGRVIVVIGAGGAARAVVAAAADAGAREVVVHARRPEAARDLVQLAATLGLRARLAGGDDASGDLVVVAAAALDDVDQWLGRALRVGGAVHDLRYGPRARSLRDAALRRRALFTDGSTMLLAQAQAAAALFARRPLRASEQQAMTVAMAGWLRSQP